MLISDVIAVVTATKPNNFSEADYIRHLNDLESYLAKNVYGNAEYTTMTATTDTLGVPEEFDRIYEEYLYAKIDFEDGRQDLYQLSYGQYMNTYTDLRNHVNRSSTKTVTRFTNYM